MYTNLRLPFLVTVVLLRVSIAPSFVSRTNAVRLAGEDWRFLWLEHHRCCAEVGLQDRGRDYDSKAQQEWFQRFSLLYAHASCTMVPRP